MGYFRELPNILYQSPLLDKNSSRDYIVIKNIFRRAKLLDYLTGSATALNQYTIGDGERPDTIAENLYGDARLDYVVVLIAGITNIHHEWPLQDYQVYDYALQKYGSESEMLSTHHYETFEIRDNLDRQILPPKLIVDEEFKIYGSRSKYPSDTRYTLRAQTGYRQLDDKDEYTVKTDNIAHAVSNIEYETEENNKRREIDILKNGYLQTFLNDLRDVVRYDKNSSYITSSLVSTENTETVNP
jgi:hypothetical protein|tara:strand:+ start:182 stop:910 length:729 start_codon:yes stop_codon:yes gene_type:complete